MDIDHDFDDNEIAAATVLEGNSNAVSSHDTTPDLVGAPFAVIESDPAVFTSLCRKLGIDGIEVVEMYDIEPWAVDHLSPLGLIFCFLWRKDQHRPAEFDDPAAELVWFANQLIDDACASHAILNIVLNRQDIQVGEKLKTFREDTRKMSSVMKGLAISNLPLVRKAHNSLARPADLRGALNAVTATTMAEQKKQKRNTNPPPTKRQKTTVTKPAAKVTEDEEETYHFISYVPAYGKVWELDGLKSGPLEVGECTNGEKEWMDVVRPALRMKMEKYGGHAEGEGNIRFSLLALVEAQYQKMSDEFEFLKRKMAVLERRLDETEPQWRSKVDSALIGITPEPGPVFAKDFGMRKMDMQLDILDLPQRKLIEAWEECVREAIPAKLAVEDEIAKSSQANTDHIKRTHDYEPFFRDFITSSQKAGILNALLDLDDDGNKLKKPKKGKK